MHPTYSAIASAAYRRGARQAGELVKHGAEVKDVYDRILALMAA